MTLSETERKKIYEEEKYRIESSKKIKDKENTKKVGIGCLVIVVIFIIFSMGSHTSPSSPSKEVQKNTSNLDGDINFDGVTLRITNTEDKNWTNCRFTLNGDYHYPSRSSSNLIGPITPDHAYTINASEFTLKDGTRFNTYTTKANNFAASCDSRFGYWGW